MFRDRTKTPLSRLIETWGSDLERVWAAITKPPEYEDTRVEDFFEARCSPCQRCVTPTCLLRRHCASGLLHMPLLMLVQCDGFGRQLEQDRTQQTMVIMSACQVMEVFLDRARAESACRECALQNLSEPAYIHCL